MKNHISSDREGALKRMLGNEIKAETQQARTRKSENALDHHLLLRIRSSKGLWTEDCLDADLVRAGRDPSNNVVLASKYCSRRQFEIFTKMDGYYIRNLSMTNPTVLIRDGRRFQIEDKIRKLSDGDQLRAGDIRLEAAITWEFHEEAVPWD